MSKFKPKRVSKLRRQIRRGRFGRQFDFSSNEEHSDHGGPQSNIVQRVYDKYQNINDRLQQISVGDFSFLNKRSNEKFHAQSIDKSVGETVTKFSFRNFDRRDATLSDKVNVLRRYSTALSVEFKKIQKNTAIFDRNINMIGREVEGVKAQQKQLARTMRDFQRQMVARERYKDKQQEGRDEFMKLKATSGGMMNEDAVKKLLDERLKGRALTDGLIAGTAGAAGAVIGGLSVAAAASVRRMIAAAVGAAAGASAKLIKSSVSALRRNIGTLAKTALRGMTLGQLGIFLARNLSAPAAVTMLMANEEKMKVLEQDVRDARNEIERLNAATKVARKAGALTTRKNKAEHVAGVDATILELRKTNAPPFEIAKQFVAKIKAQYVGTPYNDREDLLLDFLENLEGLNLTAVQYEQIMNIVGPGIAIDLQRLQRKQQKQKRRSRSSTRSRGPAKSARSAQEIGMGQKMYLGAGGIGPGPAADNSNLQSDMAAAGISVGKAYQQKKTLQQSRRRVTARESFERNRIEEAKKNFLMFGDMPEGFRMKSTIASSPGNIAPGRFQSYGFGPGGGGYSGGSYRSSGSSGGMADRTTYKLPADPDAWRKGSSGAYTGVSPIAGAPGAERMPVITKPGGVSVDPRTLTPSRSGKLKADDVYLKFMDELKDSKLIGFVPKDGAKFGIKTGSVEEWASFYTQLARQESNFNVNVRGDGGRSKGLMQMGPGQYGIRDPFDPNQAVKGAIKQGEQFVLKSGHIAGRGRGAGTYQGYRGVAAYFGPLRRQNEFFQHNEFMRELRAKMQDDPRIKRETATTGGISYKDPAGLANARAILARAKENITPASDGIAMRVLQKQRTMAGHRKNPLDENLVTKLNYAAAKAGVEVQVFSGSQTGPGASRPPGASPEHDRGGAADFELFIRDKSGNRVKLDYNNPEHAPIIDNFTREAGRAGVRSAGTDYMHDGRTAAARFHMGISRNNPLAYRGRDRFKNAWRLGYNDFREGRGVSEEELNQYSTAAIAERQRLAKEKDKIKVAEKVKPKSMRPDAGSARLAEDVSMLKMKQADAEKELMQYRKVQHERRQDEAGWQVPNPRLAQEIGMTKEGRSRAEEALQERKSAKLAESVKERVAAAERRGEIIRKHQAAKAPPGVGPGEAPPARKEDTAPPPGIGPPEKGKDGSGGNEKKVKETADAYVPPAGGGRYNPETEAESPGDGGYGAGMRCWV